MAFKADATASDLAIRPAALRDLPAVRDLAYRVWHAHYRSILSAAQIEYMLERGYALDVLERFVRSPDAGLVLAERGGTLTGFAAWLAPEKARDEIKLDRLYVELAHQRSGVGARLIEEVARQAKALGARSLVLNVNKHNTSAQAAYRKRGFAVREAVVVDIGGGFVMDDYVMERAL